MIYSTKFHINFADTVALENIANGMCLIASFIQGFFGERIVESEIKRKIADAILFMIHNIDQVR